MIVKAIVVTLHLHEAKSLKDKRQVLKSLLDQVRRKFNVSIAEVGEQDSHRMAVLGIACVSNSDRHADQSLDTVVRLIENQVDADIVSVERW
ncbi:MAG: DUF503 domain-containing protein [Bacillota bacterium]|nr:DUF503 domain-containing protein [Bacillota bacterium]